MAPANGNDERKVTSLRELPRAIDPPRDLWSDIEARIATERGSEAMEPVVGRRVFSRRHSQLRWIAAAAAIACLAVGAWIGRSVLPLPGRAPDDGVREGTPARAAKALQAAYFSDPRYRRQHQALAQSLQARLQSLPPDSRAKVVASLATIHKSMQDLEAALGRDPSNALLQELLVDTYQDEMRVLTAVHEASDAGKGI